MSSVTLSIFYSDFLESVVVSSVVMKLLIEEMDDLIAGYIQKLSGVGDDNYCSFTVADVVLEPHYSVQI